VEFVELDRDLHPFFVATQAHPELKSRPTRPHPLFSAFIAAALAYNASDRLAVEIADDDVLSLPVRDSQSQAADLTSVAS
jgi:CTP synthase